MSAAPSEIAIELGATFGHEPSEVHTAAGPAGTCCGNCFVDWPCAVIRKIDRDMVPVVERLQREMASTALREAADWIWDEAPAISSASAELHARADEIEPS